MGKPETYQEAFDNLRQKQRALFEEIVKALKIRELVNLLEGVPMMKKCWMVLCFVIGIMAIFNAGFIFGDGQYFWAAWNAFMGVVNIIVAHKLYGVLYQKTEESRDPMQIPAHVDCRCALPAWEVYKDAVLYDCPQCSEKAAVFSENKLYCFHCRAQLMLSPYGDIKNTFADKLNVYGEPTPASELPNDIKPGY